MERALGPDHPNVAASLHNLALVYQAQGRYEAAEPLLQRALELCEQLLGLEHPHTATVRENYVILTASATRGRIGQVSDHRLG
jgi:tetratricopeptide (TPR) repeat protein